MWLSGTCTWTTQVTDGGQGKGRHRIWINFSYIQDMHTESEFTDKYIYHHYIVQILHLDCNELTQYTQTTEPH